MRLARASLETPPLPLGVDKTARSAGEGALVADSVRALSTPSPQPSPRGRGSFALAASALVIAAVATRLPFMTQTLYAFDSANYALAVRDFYNVAFHQPHPPGYPLYVFLARAIDLVAHDANKALIIEGILWSTLAVGCTTILARQMFGRLSGLL